MVEPATNEAQPGQLARHVRDYSRFTYLLKWAAIIAAATVFLVLLMIG